jgi:hypothetical protein
VRVTPWRGLVRPYLIGGATLQHSSVTGLPPVDDDHGFLLGAGAEAGRSIARLFGEAKVVKSWSGSGYGMFWGGFRIHLRR